MGRVSQYPAATFCAIELLTSDVARARGYYGQVLGWEFENRADGTALARRDGAVVASVRPVGGEEQPHWLSWIAVDDVAEIARRVVDLGGALSSQYADGAVVASDVSGAKFGLRPRSDGVAELVNELGAWTWNELVTADVDSAARFYGELLGWQAERVNAPLELVSLTLGNLLIAGIHAPTSAEPNGPRWDVSFRVADVGAAAESAQRAGGRVVVPPMDIPIGRLTVVADADGLPASFTSFDAPFGGVDGS